MNARTASGTFRLRTLAQVKALSEPLRQRMLACFAAGPCTPMQVALQLGEKPTRLYHHVAILEAAGLVRLVEKRPKRGTVEHYYRAVAMRFALDPRLLTGGGAGAPSAAEALLARAFEGTLAEMRAQLPARGGRGRTLLARGHVHGTPARLADFRRRLEALIREYARPAAGTGETAGFLAAVYPVRAPAARRRARKETHE